MFLFLSIYQPCDLYMVTKKRVACLMVPSVCRGGYLSSLLFQKSFIIGVSSSLESSFMGHFKGSSPSSTADLRRQKSVNSPVGMLHPRHVWLISGMVSCWLKVLVIFRDKQIVELGCSRNERKTDMSVTCLQVSESVYCFWWLVCQILIRHHLLVPITRHS